MAKKVLELNVDFKDQAKSGDLGSFSLQPLERGYGTTLGNAMRRILLTSIPGAAITHLKIDGVQHEFSSIEGVKEDVADIIMNLKKVRFKLMDNEPDKITLNLKGKKVFTAQDIQDASDQYKVLNPDEYITEINSNGKMNIELRIGIGKGYVPSELQYREYGFTMEDLPQYRNYRIKLILTSTNQVYVPRIQSWTKCRGFSRAPHSKFIHICLSNHYCS